MIDVRSRAHRLWHRVGRRGVTLLFLALVDLSFPLGLAKQPAALRATYEVFVPWQAWSVLWAITGLICLVQAFARRDRIAYSAAVMIKVAWGVTALSAWLLRGVPLYWLSAVVWLAFAGLIALISTWPEAWDRS